jgi:hypothetical protein
MLPAEVEVTHFYGIWPQKVLSTGHLLTFTENIEREISNLYVECGVLWLLFLLHSNRFLLQFVLQAVRKHVQGILVVHAYISAQVMTTSMRKAAIADHDSV